MINFHRVADDRFTDLASGLGGAPVVRELAAAQLSKRLLLIRHLSRCMGSPKASHLTEILVEADRRNREAVVDLIGYPLVAAWAASTVRRLQATDRGEPANDDLAQFATLTAAAAIRSEIDVKVSTRTKSRTVALPGIGSVILPADGPVVISVAGGQAEVMDGTTRIRLAEEDSRWRPVRSLTATSHDLVGSLVLEDGNPYRDCYHVPPADRLTSAETERWQDLFDEAWDLLATHIPERATELAAGMRVVVPLDSAESGTARSGTTRDAFGMAGLTRPCTGIDLAITLVHEFQHSKLSALIDLVPLWNSMQKERHFAPWRADPRPTGGLMQGVYAFLGIADTWRALRGAPGHEEKALREFALERHKVEAGLTALESSRELTENGRYFVAGLKETTEHLLAIQLPKSAVDAAIKNLKELHRTWQENR